MRDFDGLGEPIATTEQTDRQGVAHALRHLMLFSSGAVGVLLAYHQAHGLPALLASLSPAQDAKLRALWPVVQAAGDSQSPPVNVPNLPAP